MIISIIKLSLFIVSMVGLVFATEKIVKLQIEFIPIITV